MLELTIIKRGVFMIGTCLCEKIEVKLEKKKNKVGACYCGMCRKWADGALYYIWKPYLEGDFGLEGKDNINEYVSSEKAKRGFCKNCGTSLYYKLTSGEFFFNAGLFSDYDSDFELIKEYDVEQKPRYIK